MVTQKGTGALYRSNYTYDNNGNILTVTGTDPVTYTYDSMNRLASETRNGVTTTYTYDSRGNLVKETKGTEVTNYTYAGDNRLTQMNKNGKIITYEYDLNGNRIEDNGVPGEDDLPEDDFCNQYGYDEENLLVYVDMNGTLRSYEIGTDGLRISGSEDYVYDKDGNVIREGTSDIIRGHQALAKRTEDGSYYYYIYNAHGDVVMMLDESGNVQNRYQYDAWGKITSETENVPNSIKYAGEYYDAETGFIYLRNRMYDPATRRFTSEDPARDQLNWYVYCGNNPVMFVDPWGLRYESVRQMAEDAGGTVEWDGNRNVAIVRLNGKKIEYYSGDGKGSFIDGTDGKLYVDGSTFAKDFGASYEEKAGDGYEGYILIIPITYGQIKVESLKFTYTVAGEHLASNFNNRQNEANGDSILFTTIIASVYAMGASVIIGGVTVAGTSGLSYAGNHVDVSFKLRAGERITVRTTGGYAPNGRAALTYDTIVRNTSGNVRQTAWRRY